jgi:tetratricopeptide (TPR) repeat protein
MRRRESKTTDLRDELSRALRAERFADALSIYELIEKRKPNEPRWAHRKGDLLRKMGRVPDAALAYERAVHLYSTNGFDSRAAAMAKLLVSIDPSKADVLAWAKSEATRRRERHSRSLLPAAS